MRVTLLILVLLLGAISRAQSTGLGVIHGAVRDFETGKPVSGAVVSIVAGDSKRTSKTDEAGAFSFTGLPLGTYGIEASRAGYQNVSLEIDVTEDRAALAVTINMYRLPKFVVHLTDRYPWDLVYPSRTADIYVPVFGFSGMNVFDSAFQALFFVPGLTFGNAPRMMR